MVPLSLDIAKLCNLCSSWPIMLWKEKGNIYFFVSLGEIVVETPYCTWRNMSSVDGTLMPGNTEWWIGNKGKVKMYYLEDQELHNTQMGQKYTSRS